VYFFSAKAFLISAIVIVKIVYLGFLASYTSGVRLVESSRFLRRRVDISRNLRLVDLGGIPRF
jgi:hypothetical protein